MDRLHSLQITGAMGIVTCLSSRVRNRWETDQARTQDLAGTVFSNIAISNTVTGSTVLVKVVPGVVQ